MFLSKITQNKPKIITMGRFCSRIKRIKRTTKDIFGQLFKTMPKGILAGRQREHHGIMYRQQADNDLMMPRSLTIMTRYWHENARTMPQQWKDNARTMPQQWNYISPKLPKINQKSVRIIRILRITMELYKSKITQN